MSIPTIYCDKRQALPNDEITVIASIGSGEWAFPNADADDIEIVSGSLTSESLTFKCLDSYDPLTVSFMVVGDEIQNGSVWADSTGDDVLGNYWTTPSGQENSILTGYNFSGRSQRVAQSLSGSASISQANLTISGASYNVEFDYRASSDIELKVADLTYTIPATNEGSSFPIYPIVHGAGLVEFEIANGTGVKWILADGTVDTSDSISKVMVAGTSYLIVDDFSTVSISSNDTESNYIGSLSDIPSGLSVIELDNSGVTGDISEIGHIVDAVSVTDSDDVYGDISNFSEVTSVVSVSGCPNISGDIEVLDYTNRIILDGTGVSGSVAVSADAVYWSLNNTSLDKSDLELSLVRLAEYASANNVDDGFFECYDDMPTVDSDDACDAITSLVTGNGWYVMVHSSCGGSES